MYTHYKHHLSLSANTLYVLLHTKTAKFFIVLVWLDTYLVIQRVPAVTAVSEVERRERETDFSKELVLAKPVPVPHTQPQSTRAQLRFGKLVLQGIKVTIILCTLRICRSRMMFTFPHLECFIVDWVQCLLLDASLLFGVFGFVRKKVALDVGIRVAVAVGSC